MTRIAEFVAAARRRVADGAYEPEGPRLEPQGSLRDALVADEHAIIAELKPASPSAGRLLDRPAEEVVDAYRAGGATALSVLAASDDFDGSPALVRTAHAAGRPLLWKDFVVDEAQLECAAHDGASAVLLIERCFDRAEDREALVAAAHTRGLEVLLELFHARDATRAADSAAEIVGVNARDLDTLDVDAAGARRLVARLANGPRPVLALSGIRDRTDRRDAEAAGAAGVLVGTALMQHADPALALRGLRRPLAKVCGLTDAEGVAAAADAGADLAGFVVGSPDSPRDISVADAVPLAAAARDRGLRPVLVTRAKDATAVEGWAAAMRPAFIQVHVAAAAKRLDPGRILYAVAPTGNPPDTGGLVVDTPRGDGRTGGAGKTHDWTETARLLAALRGRMSLVAGGLAADNAAAAIAATGAWGADASSRLERAPGKKDANAVAGFVTAVQEADA